MKLFEVVVRGSDSTYYGTDTWMISVWFDSVYGQVYTEDMYGDTDIIIDDVDDKQEALNLAYEYFSEGYEILEVA